LNPLHYYTLQLEALLKHPTWPKYGIFVLLKFGLTNFSDYIDYA